MRWIFGLLFISLIFAQNLSETRPLKWDYRTGDFISAAPAEASGLMFIGSADRFLYALNSSNGLLVWRYEGMGEFQAAPAHANGALFIGDDGFALHALNLSNGRILWNRTLDGKIRSLPAIGGGVYVTTTNGTIYAYTFDGDELWQKNLGAPIFSSPILSADSSTIFVANNAGHLLALAAEGGSVLWDFADAGGPFSASPILWNEMIFIGSFDHSLYAVNSSDGSRIWSFETSDKIATGAAAGRGIVWVGSSDGRLYALNAYNGAKLWERDIGESIASDVAFSPETNAVYFGAQDNNIHALRSNTGEPIWSYQTGNWVIASPRISPPFAYAASYDGRIYAISTLFTTLDEPAPNAEVRTATVVARGHAYADAGVRQVEVRIDEGNWRIATGTGEWTYTFSASALGLGPHTIQVRAIDSNGFREAPPYRQSAIIVLPSGELREFAIEFPESVTVGQPFQVTVRDASGQAVPYARIDMDGKTFYANESGSATATIDHEGSFDFAVTKEGYRLPAGHRPLRITASSQLPWLLIGAGAVVVIAIALLLFFILSRRKS